MEIKELIDRINELYRKKIKEGLTKEEQQEQEELRSIYIQKFRENFRAQLEGIKVITPDEQRDGFKN